LPRGWSSVPPLTRDNDTHAPSWRGSV
jgi:hypothetical protein